MNKEIDTKIDALNAKIDATLRQIAGFTHDADAILCLTEDTLETTPSRRRSPAPTPRSTTRGIS